MKSLLFFLNYYTVASLTLIEKSKGTITTHCISILVSLHTTVHKRQARTYVCMCMCALFFSLLLYYSITHLFCVSRQNKTQTKTHVCIQTKDDRKMACDAHTTYTFNHGVLIHKWCYRIFIAISHIHIVSWNPHRWRQFIFSI